MITYEQYRKLRTILRANGTLAKDYEKRKDLYDYLLHQQYIKFCIIDCHWGFIVTQQGKVEIKSFKDDHHRFWITTFLSILALILSVVSIIIQTPILTLLQQLR